MNMLTILRAAALAVMALVLTAVGGSVAAT